jgi:parallel beta-helix repeat protein
VLRNLHDVVVENLTIGPCGKIGIELIDSEQVTLRNVTVTDTNDVGIYVDGSSSVVVEGSRITNTLSGVYAVRSTGVRVRCNTIEDVRGPIPRGQFVQFDKVTGPTNEVSCNVGLNRPGRGLPEDAISLYKSSGLPDSPIIVERNLIIGGGPSTSGGGIMLGDDGGAYLVARDNILVDPGQYGIAVASGWHMAIVGNQIFARRQSFTNVGISVWNQYPSSCGKITVMGNDVRWLSKIGKPNPYWDAGNCGKVRKAQNNFSAPLSPEIAATGAPECGCGAAGRASR